jgi:hypothetical protein
MIKENDFDSLMIKANEIMVSFDFPTKKTTALKKSLNTITTIGKDVLSLTLNTREPKIMLFKQVLFVSVISSGNRVFY